MTIKPVNTIQTRHLLWHTEETNKWFYSGRTATMWSIKYYVDVVCRPLIVDLHHYTISEIGVREL